MFDWMYILLIFLVVVSTLTAFRAAWNNRSGLMYFCAGLALLFAGLTLNLAGLRHIVANGVHYSFAALPSWVFSSAVIAGLILMSIGSLKMWLAYKKAERIKNGETNDSARHGRSKNRRKESQSIKGDAQTEMPDLAESSAR